MAQAGLFGITATHQDGMYSVVILILRRGKFRPDNIRCRNSCFTIITAFAKNRWAIGGGGGVGTFIFYSAVLGMFSGFFVNWRVHLLLLAYPIVFVLYMSTMQGNFMRNMTAVNAFFCIFAGLFIFQVLNIASEILKKIKTPDVFRKTFFVLAIILVLSNPLYKAINWSIETYNTKDTRVLAVAWMKKIWNRRKKLLL